MRNALAVWQWRFQRLEFKPLVLGLLDDAIKVQSVRVADGQGLCIGRKVERLDTGEIAIKPVPTWGLPILE